MLDLAKQTPNKLTDIRTRTTNPVFESFSVAKSNQENLSQLIDIQEETGEGCFFVGLYSLNTVLFPDRELPVANDYLTGINDRYEAVLKKDSLTVRYDKIETALKIYDEWNIKLTKLSVNNTGESVFGKYLLDKNIPKQNVSSWKSLSTDHLNPPYSIVVHQAGGNNSHYITLDGTEKSQSLMEKYVKDGYRIIAVFEFETDCR